MKKNKYIDNWARFINESNEDNIWTDPDMNDSDDRWMDQPLEKRIKEFEFLPTYDLTDLRDNDPEALRNYTIKLQLMLLDLTKKYNLR